MLVGDTLWGLDSGDKLLALRDVTPDNIQGGQTTQEPQTNDDFLLEGNQVNLFHQCANFKQFDLQDKPTSFQVHNGGWVIYEKPNYKGKWLYHHDGDCFSHNQTINKAVKLKSWQTPIGSIRPLVGLDLQLFTVKLELDWASMTKEMTSSNLYSVEGKNTTFLYAAPEWESVKRFDVSVSHR